MVYSSLSPAPFFRTILEANQEERSCRIKVFLIQCKETRFRRVTGFLLVFLLQLGSMFVLWHLRLIDVTKGWGLETSCWFVHIEVSLAVKLRVNTFSLINHLSKKSHITYILFIPINMCFLIVSMGAHKIQQLKGGSTRFGLYQSSVQNVLFRFVFLKPPTG